MGDPMNVTARKSTGETSQETIPDDNGNGIIDDKGGMDAAAVLLIDHESLTTESGQVFDQKAYDALLSGQPEQPTAPQEAAIKATATPPTAPKTNFVLSPYRVTAKGGYGFGVGSLAHNGPVASLEVSMPLSPVGKLSATGSVGIGYSRPSMTGLAPDNHEYTSKMNVFTAQVGYRLSKPLTGRVSLGFGGTAGLGYSHSIAGGQPSSSGPDVAESASGHGGRVDPLAQAAYPTDEVVLSAGLAVGLEAKVTNKLSLVLDAGVGINYFTAGNAVDLSNVQVSGGIKVPLDVIIGRKTKPVNGAEGPIADARGDANVTESPYAANQALSLSKEDVRKLAGLSENDDILGVKFDDLPEDTSERYDVGAESMKEGEHDLKVRYLSGADGKEYFRNVRIQVSSEIKVPEGSTGQAYGAVLEIPASAQRAPLVPGQLPAPISIGNIQTTADFPADSSYQVYVDGNPVGSAEKLPADRRTDLTIPATIGDGAHLAQIRILRPKQPSILYPVKALNIAPATAFAAAPKMEYASYNNRNTVQPRVMLLMTAPQTGTTITVNGTRISGFDGTLKAGDNRIALSVPSMKMTNNVRGVARGIYKVEVTIGNETKSVDLSIHRGRTRTAPPPPPGPVTVTPPVNPTPTPQPSAAPTVTPAQAVTIPPIKAE